MYASKSTEVKGDRRSPRWMIGAATFAAVTALAGSAAYACSATGAQARSGAHKHFPPTSTTVISLPTTTASSTTTTTVHLTTLPPTTAKLPSATAPVPSAPVTFTTQPVTVSSVKPPAGGYFQTLAPGSSLPSDSECAASVHRSTWEPRPSNTTANHTTPTAGSSFTGWDWGGSAASVMHPVTGNFTGTTDEIMQWGACKWGFSDDLVRAEAVSESFWQQDAKGDVENEQSHCASGYTALCPTSFGILQLRWYLRPGSWPWASTSTAFNVDHSLAERRACYEGLTYLGPQTKGNMDQCMDLYFSGEWNISTDDFYHRDVNQHVVDKPWLSW